MSESRGEPSEADPTIAESIKRSAQEELSTRGEWLKKLLTDFGLSEELDRAKEKLDEALAWAEKHIQKG